MGSVSLANWSMSGGIRRREDQRRNAHGAVFWKTNRRNGTRAAKPLNFNTRLVSARGPHSTMCLNLPKHEKDACMTQAVIVAPQWIAPVAPEARVLTGHAVLIEQGAIAALAPLDALRERPPDVPSTPLPGQLLTPGFVNLHTHAAMALLRGVADDLPLRKWLNERIWPLESKLVSPAFVRDGALLAAHEMLLGGTTCFNDMYFFPEAAIEAA